MSASNQLKAIQDGMIAFRLNPQADVRLKAELKISENAREILSSPHTEESKLLMDQLRLARAELVPNASKDVATTLELNLVQSIPPTPICPAYNKIGVPTVSTYHLIGPNIASVRLDPQSIQAVPQSLRDQMGDLSQHRVDFFFTVIHGKQFRAPITEVAKGPLNLRVHAWAHPHTYPGEDVHKNCETGLLPIMGIQRALFDEINPRHVGGQNVNAVPFDGLRSFDVHAHMSDENVLAKNMLYSSDRAALAKEMLYSPDNMHFNLAPDSPFAVFWSGAKTDDRACITKMLVILDCDDPIARKLFESVRGNPTLLSHVKKLREVAVAIDEYFDPIIEDFKSGNSVEAMQRYQDLPEMYKTGIHFETWKLHQQPMGIHADFGRFSFENDPTLDAVWHSQNPQRAHALHAFKESLKQTLVHSQTNMFIQDLTLARSDCSVTLMKCARTFQKNAAKGLQKFQTLPEEMQQSVFLAFWELSGSPKIPDFGRLKFFGSSAQVKVQSLLLAASRQTDVFVPQIISSTLYMLCPEFEM